MPPKTMKFVVCLAIAFVTMPAARAADAPKKRDINLDDLARLQRVGSPAVSPDGEWVVYTVGQVDAKEDKNQTHLWMVKWDGSVHLQLTYGKEGASAFAAIARQGVVYKVLAHSHCPVITLSPAVLAESGLKYVKEHHVESFLAGVF